MSSGFGGLARGAEGAEFALVRDGLDGKGGRAVAAEGAFARGLVPDGRRGRRIFDF